MSDRLPATPALEAIDPMPYPAAPAAAPFAPSPPPATPLDALARRVGAALLAPLAGAWRPPAAWIEVSPREESRLFTFVRRVAIEVQSPAPERIFLAPDDRLAAGAASLAASRGRALVVGLAYLHRLGLSELKAALAHALALVARPVAAVDQWRAAFLDDAATRSPLGRLLREAQGVSRDEVILADRVAARAAGSEAALGAMVRAREASARWAALVEALDDARDDGALTEDLYAHLDTVRPAPSPHDDGAREAALRALRLPAEPDRRSAWALLRDPPATRREVTLGWYAARGDRGALAPAAQVERALSQERDGVEADPRWRGAFTDRAVDPGEVDDLVASAADPARYPALLRGTAAMFDEAVAARVRARERDPIGAQRDLRRLDGDFARADLALALALGEEGPCARRWSAQRTLSDVVATLDAMAAMIDVLPPAAMRAAMEVVVLRTRAAVAEGEGRARELDPEGARARRDAKAQEVVRAMRRRARRLALRNLRAILSEHLAREARWRAAGCPRPRPPSLSIPADLKGAG